MRNLYAQMKQELELMAVRVLEICHEADPEKSELLIEQKHPTWGEINCLEMAAVGDCQVFHLFHCILF